MEEQLTRAEQDYNQTRCDIEELSCMEKDYVNQGIQTELDKDDLRNLENVAVKIPTVSLLPNIQTLTISY